MRDLQAEHGFSGGDLEDKFRRLTRRALGEPGATSLFQRLPRLEGEKDLNWLGS